MHSKGMQRVPAEQNCMVLSGICCTQTVVHTNSYDELVNAKLQGLDISFPQIGHIRFKRKGFQTEGGRTRKFTSKNIKKKLYRKCLPLLYVSIQ